MLPTWILLIAFLPGGPGQQASTPQSPAPQAPRPPAVTEAVIVQGRIGEALPLEPRLPGSFHLLTGDDLALSHPLSVNDALRKVPGIVVRDEEGLGLRPNIGIRGLNPTRSSKVLLLEDGMPVTYAPYGDNASYYHPPLQRFEAVEVLKGSGQIAYGPSTIGGVINYITPLPPSEPAGMVSMRGGNRSFLDGGASFGSTRRRLGHFVTAQGVTSDGSRAAIRTSVWDGTAKFTFAASPAQLIVLRTSHHRERSRNTYSGLRASEYAASPRQNPFVNDTFDADRTGASLSHHAAPGGRMTLATTGYVSRFARDWWRQSSNSAQRPNDASDPACAGMERLNTTCGNEGRLRRYVVGGVESRATIAAGGGVTSLGARVHAEAQRRRQENGETPRARAGRLVEHNERGVVAVSGFAQHRAAVGRFSVTPGVRVEHVRFHRVNLLAGAEGRTSATQVIPGVGAALSLGPRALVFGGLHRGFAPPRVEDAISNSGGIVDLDAELSWNAELGFRARGTSGLQVDATVFRMDYQNQIVPASLAGGLGATLTNGGETLHAGLEVAARGSLAVPFPQAARVYTRVAYTYLPVAEFRGARFSNVPGFANVRVTGNRLPYAPEHVATVTGGYQAGDRTDLFAELVFLSSQYADDLNTVPGSADGQRGRIDGSATWNAGVNVQALPGRLHLFAAAYNVADRLYIADRSRGILPGPPRRIQAGMRLMF